MNWSSHAKLAGRYEGDVMYPYEPVDRPASRRMPGKTALLLVAMIAAPIGVVAGATYWSDLTGSAGTEAEVLRTPPPTTATSAQEPGVVRLHEPFANTPAAAWQDGIEGITADEATAVGEFSAAEVTAAVNAVKDNIEASYLDRTVIEEHDFAPYLATLAPEMATLAEEDLGDPATAAGYVTLIHPDYPLLPATPKTNGSLSVTAGEPGELIVRARFAVAYAFDTEHPQRLFDPFDIVTVARTETEFYLLSGSGWEESSHGLWLGESEGFLYSLNCDTMSDGYLAPQYSDRRWNGSGPEHDEEYYFDPEEPLSIDEDCSE